ncbi:MAG: hypothetical protein ACW99G_10205 [Candidatus Thorarchaeota archaeon]|jgi:hypothetical protein
MSERNIALVVPTIRENCIKDFLDRWKGIEEHVDIIIMEDNQEKSFDIDVAQHLCWQDIKEDNDVMGKIIPRRSDTVRSYAYYWAWKMGYEFIMTLDDDCYPPTQEIDGVEYPDPKAFVDYHLSMLGSRTKWFNTLNNVKPRGIPFYNLGKRDDVIVNHGLWTNVLDYDAPTQLVNPIEEKFSFDSKLVPQGSYFPMCGMNVMWKAEYTPLMYHLLMGSFIGTTDGTNVRLTKYPFDRFGDIWCGIFMKRCADILDKNVATGMPYIRHERASNPFTNLKKEANGLEVNEKIWEYVDQWYPETPIVLSSYESTMETVSRLYESLGVHINGYDEFPEYVEYFKELGRAMVNWALLFRKNN